MSCILYADSGDILFFAKMQIILFMTSYCALTWNETQKVRPVNLVWMGEVISASWNFLEHLWRHPEQSKTLSLCMLWRQCRCLCSCRISRNSTHSSSCLMVYSFSSCKFYLRCWQPFEYWPLIERVKGFQTLKNVQEGCLLMSSVFCWRALLRHLEEGWFE
jgi:hypothetical protein